ncbi:hypothetical protein [Anaerobiospirillum sp. NML120449]|uniref:hypothetical protein n=1 Tax=Anaerobiospirillum sp. NML120449 TaxID=2932817 RepID=UPI001FF50F3C|nr:hypothetical protein [Anaerobiospirillum sp. NML120449]MCK0525384.1 hypothetical protein [Anaerobiospirillum sp. NML120449]
MGDSKSKERLRLSVQLGEGMHRQFVEYAYSKNKKPNTLAREILTRALKNNEVKAEPARESSDSVSLHVKLNSEEVRALDFVAMHYNVSRPKAVLIIIRGMLMDMPTFTGEDRDVLSRSNVELKAIGTNLNQLVKELNSFRKHRLLINEHNLKEEVAYFKKLTHNRSLEKYIKEHVEVVRQMIKKAARRF